MVPTGAENTSPGKEPLRSKRHRAIPYDTEMDKTRNRIERCFGWLRPCCRRLATRYGKRGPNFLAMVMIGAILQWYQFIITVRKNMINESVPPSGLTLLN